MSNNTRKAHNNVMKVFVLIAIFWMAVSVACSGGDGSSTKTGSPDNNDWSNTQEQIKLEVKKLNQELPKAVENAAKLGETLDQYTNDNAPNIGGIDLEMSAQQAYDCVFPDNGQPLTNCTTK